MISFSLYNTLIYSFNIVYFFCAYENKHILIFILKLYQSCNISSRFSSNSKAFVSELLEYFLKKYILFTGIRMVNIGRGQSLKGNDLWIDLSVIHAMNHGHYLLYDELVSNIQFSILSSKVSRYQEVDSSELQYNL